MPGPVCTWERDYEVNDGTSCLMPSQTPGPTTHKSPSIWARGEALFAAYERSQVLAPSAVMHKTGYALGELLKGLLPGLLQTLIVLAAGTVLGSVAGGVIGFFFAGAGAAPGAVLGAELGLEIGTAVLSWLGLAFLAVAIVHGFGELWTEVASGVKRAWAAPEFPDRDYPHEVEKAAQDFANAVGTLFLLILQAIVAWVFKRAAVGSTKAALATKRSIAAGGSELAAAEAVASVVEQLRASKLGSGFADWVEQNWARLRDDPRLRPKARVTPDPAMPDAAPAPKTAKSSPPKSGGIDAAVPISRVDAINLLMKNGLSADRATDFIDSFDGPLTVRNTNPGETFFRYTDVANSKGSFLTKSPFATPAEASDGLYLGPYGNTASLRQTVTVAQSTQVIEGGVANGRPGIRQSLIVNRNDFQFGPGVGY